MSLLTKTEILSHYQKQQKDLFLTGHLKTFKLSENTIEKIQSKAPFFLSALAKIDYFADFNLQDQILQNNFKIQVLELNFKDVINFSNFVQYNVNFNHYFETGNGFGEQITGLDFFIFQILKDSKLHHFYNKDKSYFNLYNNIYEIENELKKFIKDDVYGAKNITYVENEIEHLLNSYTSFLIKNYFNGIEFKIVNFFDFLVFLSEKMVESCLTDGISTLSLPSFIFQNSENKNNNENYCSIFEVENYFENFMEYKNISWHEIANYSLSQANDLLKEYYESFRKI